MQNFTYLTYMVVPMPRGANYLGNILWEPVPDIAQFVQTFYLPGALRHLQGGRQVDAEDLPGVARAVAGAYGGESTVRAGRVRYEFSRDGRPWEEDVYVTLAFTPSSSAPSGGCTPPTPSGPPRGNSTPSPRSSPPW